MRHEPLVDLVRHGAAVAKDAPCHCVDVTSLEDAGPITQVCARCTFLDDVAKLEEALFFVAAAGAG